MKSTPVNFIVRLKKQKEDALDYIIDAYMPLVKAIATNILHNQKRTDIDECINDVFLAIWQNAHQFQGEAADFKKWLCVMTKYKAIDRYRQNEKQLANEQSSAPLEEEASILHTEQVLMQKEAKSEMLFALSQLEELDRNIFIMKYYLDLSNGEIAESLNLTKAAVDNRLYRGKKVLAQNPKL